MQQDILAGTFGTVIIVFTIILFLLWFLLPFAVFGIKGKLNQLIEQNKQLISILQNKNIEPVPNSEGDTTHEGVKVEPIITQQP